MQLEKLEERHIKQLFRCILALQDNDECYRFFEDLCTVNEVKSLAQRLEVARMLRGKATYHKIEEATGASTATISRVKRCLEYGEGGYSELLQRISEEN
jgi:TrpR-related protein YerC/YecD